MVNLFKKWFMPAFSGLIYLFLYAPIVVLFLYSFNESNLMAVWSKVGIYWYQKLLTNSAVINAGKNSLIVSFTATVIATLIATTTSLLMERRGKFRGKGALDGILYIPIIIPEIVLAISILSVFSLLGSGLGLHTIILGHIAFITAFIIVVIRARLKGFDGSYEEAAMDLGANSLKTFWYVTLPIISPGIIAGALLGFTLSMDDFIVTFFTAGPASTTLPLWIWGTLKRGISPEINALSVVMMLFTMSLVFLAQRFEK
jgi:spermidine/putrescine transport system permease protein